MNIPAVNQQNNIYAKRQKKNNRRDYALGTAASAASAFALRQLQISIGSKVAHSFYKAHETTPAERTELINGFAKTYKDLDLENRRVTVRLVNDTVPVQDLKKMRKAAGIGRFDIKGQQKLLESIEIAPENLFPKGVFEELYKKYTPKSLIYKITNKLVGETKAQKYLEKIAERQALKKILIYQNGKNATFLPQGLILVPETKLTQSYYHELGHAKIHYYGKLSKLLQTKGRRLSSVPVLIGLVSCAILGKQKPETENKDNKIKNAYNKTKNFFRKNIGLITFGLFAPKLINEAHASKIGNKLAKGVLSPELAKKVRNGNRAAYMTYILGAGSVAVGIQLAASVKDGVIKLRQNARTNQTQGL